MSNCKPRFIEQVLLEMHGRADVVYYFDTDIVIKHPWEVFARWARNGVVLVLDPADSYMSPHHVYRRAWQALAAKQDRTCRAFTGYVNGGCVGIGRSHADFATVWGALMEELARSGVDMKTMKNSSVRMESHAWTRMS